MQKVKKFISYSQTYGYFEFKPYIIIGIKVEWVNKIIFSFYSLLKEFAFCKIILNNESN